MSKHTPMSPIWAEYEAHIEGFRRYVMGGMSYGKTTYSICKMLELQKRNISFVALCSNVKILDRLVAAGIQPSRIKLPGEQP